jgi:hypothetical protein
MRLVGYSDTTPEIDVREGAQKQRDVTRSGPLHQLTGGSESERSGLGDEGATLSRPYPKS